MSSAKTKKRRRSQAPVAFVYFLTMLIVLGVLGGFVGWLLKQYGIIGNNDVKNENTSNYVAFTDMFVRVTDRGILGEVAVIRFCPTESKVDILPISPYTISSSGNNKTFREIYAEGGALKLQKEVSEVFGINISHYATLNPSAFDNCMDIFGGFSYTPPEDLYKLDKNNNANDLSLSKGEVVTLSGRQIRLICAYNVFSGGWQENTKFLGLALKETLNNAFRQSGLTSDNMDNIYRIISSAGDTDITKDIFKIQRSYIRDMLRENITPCEDIVPEGTWIDGTHFKPSEDFKNTLAETFKEGADIESSGSESSEASLQG